MMTPLIIVTAETEEVCILTPHNITFLYNEKTLNYNQVITWKEYVYNNNMEKKQHYCYL